MAGKIVADTLTHSTAGSLTTDYVVNGSAKAWVDGNSAAGLDNSHNISSGTDNGTGNYEYAFTAAMDSANYGIAGAVYSGSDRGFSYTGVSSANFDVRVWSSAGAANDSPQTSIIMGDLA